MSGITVNLHERVGHITVSYKHFVLVWGGLKRCEGDLELYYPTDEVWFYNCLTEVWTSVKTKGSVPFRNSGATAVVSEHYLYIYGGQITGVEEMSDDAWRYSNELHRLDLKTLEWIKLSPTGQSPQGCDKGVGWAYNEKIYFFGGYGQRSYESGENYWFDVDRSNVHGESGWHNQLIKYNPLKNTWESPKTHGLPPSPRATHAADVNGNRVYIFGGRLLRERVNEMYSLDLETMTWSSTQVMPWLKDIPEGRSWHSFNFFKKNHAIVYGGLNAQGYPCTDWWECIVNGDEVNWILGGELDTALVWHKATFSTSTKELIIVGGVTCSPYTMQANSHVKELLIMQFAPMSLVRLCLEEVIKLKLWPANSDLPKCLMDIVLARTDPDRCSTTA